MQIRRSRPRSVVSVVIMCWMHRAGTHHTQSVVTPIHIEIVNGNPRTPCLPAVSHCFALWLRIMLYTEAPIYFSSIHAYCNVVDSSNTKSNRVASHSTGVYG